MKADRTIKVITDGSVRKHKGRRLLQMGILVLFPGDIIKRYTTECVYSISTTSNECEYMALQAGIAEVHSYLKSLSNRGSANPSDYDLVMYVDSELLAKQLIGECATKKESFKSMQKTIKRKAGLFNKASVYWHRRDADLAVVADYATRNPSERIENLHIQFRQKDVSELVQEIYKRILTKERNDEQASNEK